MPAVQPNTQIHVPHDFVTITLDAAIHPPLRGIRSGAAGDLAIVDGAGNTVVITNVQAGETIRGAIQKVNTTGTTIVSAATNLLGLR